MQEMDYIQEASNGVKFRYKVNFGKYEFQNFNL